LLTWLMVVVLVVGQGSSVAASVCRHRDMSDHVAARHSQDRSIAAVALTEEAAASVAAKKGAVSGGESASAPMDMLPPAAIVVPAPPVERMARRVADDPTPASAPVRPLLPPPLD
jgi:hypothetical protein